MTTHSDAQGGKQRGKADDKAMLDWLDQNIFHREITDDWDKRQYGDKVMWVMFAPKGAQGSARNIITGAMEVQGERAPVIAQPTDAAVGRNATLSLQEIWEAVGGIPSVTPSKQEVFDLIGASGLPGRVRGLLLQAVAACDGGAPDNGEPQRFGCHIDLEPGMEPDGCVLDSGNPSDCVHAPKLKRREDCAHWKPVASRAGDNKQEGN